MTNCAILPKIVKGEGKKYSIEIHHDPFTLHDIVDLEILRREDQGESLNTLEIAQSVMELHFDGLVGLIALSKTQHELVDANKVFIPLQQIFFDYSMLYEHYAWYIENKAEYIRDKLETKLRASMECGDLQSDAASPEFVYIDCGGVSLPEVKEEWLTALTTDRASLADEEKKKEQEEQRKAKGKRVKADESTGDTAGELAS